MSLGYRLAFVTSHQEFPGILPDRLEEVVARLVAFLSHSDQRLVHQRQQAGEHICSVQIVAAADLLRCLQTEAADEHGEPTEEVPLGFGEEGITPVQGSLQGLLAGQRRAVPGGQELKLLVETSRDLFDGQSARERRGEFESQRDTVETPTNLDNRRRVCLVWTEARLSLGAIDKQAYRVEVEERREGKG